MIFDLIMAAAGAQSVAPAWTPAQLFANGESGYWVDASDLSTMFQDTAGTIPVTASGQPVALWKNKVLQPLFDFSQTTASWQPVLDIASGKYSVLFDGVDDVLRTADTAFNPNFPRVTMALGFSLPAVPLSNTYAQTMATNRGFLIRNSNQLNFNAGSNITSSNNYSLSSPNTAVAWSGSYPSETTFGIMLNDIITEASLFGENYTGGAGELSSYSAAITFKFSQAVFINRILTAEERTQLATFISGKQ